MAKLLDNNYFIDTVTNYFVVSCPVLLILLDSNAWLNQMDANPEDSQYIISTISLVSQVKMSISVLCSATSLICVLLLGLKATFSNDLYA
jgi:hypothetical protein